MYHCSSSVGEVQVHVYERARKMRPSGGSIGLFSQNVFTAFQALGKHVAEAVQVRLLTSRLWLVSCGKLSCNVYMR